MDIIAIMMLGVSAVLVAGGPAVARGLARCLGR